MRQLRILATDNPPEFGQLPKLQAQTAQRFEPGTAVNNREPLFWSPLERARFKQVLYEARARCAFALRGLRFSGPTVSFYIKPADGLMLPFIMQWLKQTFAVRYNMMKRLDGHVWGDRYWSKVLEGEPPEDGIPAEEGGRGDCGERAGAGSTVWGEEGGEIPEARSEKGPPGGDSHREGNAARNTGLTPLSPHHAAPWTGCRRHNVPADGKKRFSPVSFFGPKAATGEVRPEDWPETTNPAFFAVTECSGGGVG
jgi:hypothetical protein